MSKHRSVDSNKKIEDLDKVAPLPIPEPHIVDEVVEEVKAPSEPEPEILAIEEEPKAPVTPEPETSIAPIEEVVEPEPTPVAKPKEKVKPVEKIEEPEAPEYSPIKTGQDRIIVFMP